MENQTISMILGFQPKIYHLLRYNPSRTCSVPPQKPIAPPNPQPLKPIALPKTHPKKPIALHPTDKTDRPSKTPQPQTVIAL
jgi:hypothetical protein